MRLTEFIAQNHDAIIADWVAFAATLRPWSDGRSTKSLRNHAEELLSAVVSDMATPQTAEEKSAKSHGLTRGGTLARVGQMHAEQRLATGFDLEQLVSEYRALRASIMRLWSEDGHGGDTDVTRFHEAIDEGLSESAVRYSEMLERTREQFVGVLGHDLRNPLQAIVVGATLLSTTEALEDREARVATRILSAANRMGRMVGDLLDLTRTRLGGGIPVVFRQMDLGPVCAQVVAELEILHPSTRIHFESHGILLGEWDTDRLHQAISNLVTNALEHGSRAAGVEVVLREQGEVVVLRVHNGGTPIPEEMLAKIFEPMVQSVAGRDQQASAPGLGLGLFIARAVAAAHGGGLSVTSTESEGTTFTMQLPRSPPSAPRPREEAAPVAEVTRPTRVRKDPPRRREASSRARSA
ncbi:MAG: sensor histidine kinase [Deltaproteobacteria bacterium]|nr:sensor histidine kinase [Deltaproteobacteria bacterium]